MDVLFITGSARNDGVTAKLCDILAGAMSSSEITTIRPHDLSIGHCTGCGSCAGNGICVMNDDMHQIYQAVEKSDIIVISTPVYFSGPSSIIKQVIDRFQCVWAAGKKSTKKRTAALIAAGGRRSPIFSNTISIVKAFAVTIGAEWAGELTISGTDGMKEISDEITKEACSFGSRIVSRHLENI